MLADAGIAPAAIWRAKYHQAGAWDGAGAARAFDHYATGLHRRAYSDTLWVARFVSEAEAARAAPQIAAAAKLTKEGAMWKGAQPAYANGTYPGEKTSPGPLTLWQRGASVLMSTRAAAPASL